MAGVEARRKKHAEISRGTTEAAAVFQTYAGMVAECQSQWFRSEVERLRPLV